MSGSVDGARKAFARQAWAEVYVVLAAEIESIEAEDLERLAVAAYLLGQDDESARAWEQAHAAWMRRGDLDRAARCGFWLAFGLLLRGDTAQGSGWLARAARLVDQLGSGCVAAGYLRVVPGIEARERGDPSAATAIAGEIVEVARRFGDRDLLALGVLGEGQAATASGQIRRGMALLDEVMVSVAAGEVSPIPAGIVYCAVVDTCMAVFDLSRAAEWTDALDRWCAAQPDLVPYRGHCLVHRAQLLQAHGAWGEASAEAERACRHLSQPVHPALGLALYQQGELHRLQGDRADAERAYRAASQQGREPAPGLALLRLAQGRVDAAVVAIRRMVEESIGQLAHPAMLAACVEIMLAAGEIGAARCAVDQLSRIAQAADAKLLDAITAYASGSVMLAEEDPKAALAALRRAHKGWHDLEMPYDAARARVRIAAACRALGDHDSAHFELDAARVVFERLNARPDLAEVTKLLRRSERSSRRGGLTQRECEVLRHVATGKTDREIAADLVISEHTVARHLQNIFRKVGLSSRAAATAYAYEHELL